MMSYTNNQAGRTMKPYAEMTGPELVEAFNKLTGQSIKRFTNRETALRRIKAAENGGTAATPLPKTEGGILESFQARAGTNREKLIKCMVENFGKPVQVDELLKATYGNKNVENRGALMMVMKGMRVMIEKYNLPYNIIKGKTEEGLTYGLVKK